MKDLINELLQNMRAGELKDWFYSLQGREKAYLLGGSAALILVLVYLILWQPLSAAVTRLETTVAQEEQDLAWMQAASDSIKKLQRSNGGQRRAGRRSMLSAVDQAINTANLKAGLQRMEPDGQNTVKLWLNKSSFDQIILMLGQLEQTQGIAVQTLAITSASESGLVDARITLARGGA
ncbi:MAG TPA: type II secretion system protein GspM [Gammaproteobacteria bacterium]